MSKGKKWLVAGAGAVVLAGLIYGSIQYSRQGIVTVQTSRVLRQDLVSQVTASGEIKPRNYVNIGATSMGRLTEIYVKEGDRVTKGQTLAKVETVQSAAEVSAQQAALRAAQGELAAATAAIKSTEENLRTVKAGAERAVAERERARLSFERARQLSAEQLVARQEFDLRKAEYDGAVAGVAEAEGRISQIQAQREQVVAQRETAQRRIEQFQASLTRATDVLQKHYSVAPIDGVVTNLPVRVGESVVYFQNFSPTLIMTVADMSVGTAEVLVDETDIVQVKMNQAAGISIDAIPDKVFPGRVIEIGTTAILRASGRSASESLIASQEARDFKVVIGLESPPEQIRPGLSCTAKITTATRKQVLTVPIQALAIRTPADLEPARKASEVAHAADRKTTAPAGVDPRREIQGVFVVSGNRCLFLRITTGVVGASDIEVLDGLKEAAEIITGSYKVLRTIRPGTMVKVDNRAIRRTAEEEK